MIHIGKFIETYYDLLCNTQSFINIKKGDIVDPMIDFDDHEILSNYDTNYMFQYIYRIF